MSKITGNEQVYPYQYSGRDQFDWKEIKYGEGMTLRQYYAGLAMQGLMAGADTKVDIEKLANWSVLAADALIKELNNHP